MILVDTSVWVDHLRSGDERLSSLLVRGRVLGHPWVVGEVALGSIGRRDEVLALLDALPTAVSATDAEVRALVDRPDVHGSGLGWVDVAILASTLLTPGAALWTRDRRLVAVAGELEVAAQEK